MAYTINLTNGTIFATIADGTINTSSSMVLVGKNYAGYGEFLDENFIHLLENSADTAPPGAPLDGQLWWDSGAGLLKVYNGSGFKNIASATAVPFPGPTSNVTGDLWFDTTNSQLKVWTGTTWLLVGPQFTAGTGVTGAIVDTITDNTAVNHVVIKLFVQDSVVGIVSKDATFTPQVAISGFTTVRPGITLSTLIGSQIPLFQGIATSAQGLVSGNVVLTPINFMRSDQNTSTTGTLSVLNNSGLSVGDNSDFRVTVAGTAVSVNNQTSGGNFSIGVNVGGTPTPALSILGTTGVVGVLGISNLNAGNGVGNIGSSSNYFNRLFATATTALYADVAERFAADQEYAPGTVVELGGVAEITRSNTDLSDNVFGVISTQAAYLMNGGAGSDVTHPPVAMTGRVPVLVTGTVRKGDRLVSAGNGLARAAQPGEATAFNTVGRALHDKLEDNQGTVEAIVTIK
jgi:hypothetical protein